MIPIHIQYTVLYTYYKIEVCNIQANPHAAILCKDLTSVSSSNDDVRNNIHNNTTPRLTKQYHIQNNIQH